MLCNLPRFTVCFYSGTAELVLKCHVIHSSTRVCILKNKTVVNIKNPLPSAPLGILQFQTDFSNLTLQVSGGDCSQVKSRVAVYS